MNLYQITSDLLKVINGGMVVEDETGEILFEPSDLEALEGEYLDKLEACALWVKNEQAEIEAIKAEERNLAERRKAKEKRIESMRRYILQSMEDTDTAKLETPKVSLSTRKSQRVIVDDESAIPAEYLRVAQIVDKAALKRALRMEDVAGAHIEECVNLQLK